MNLEEKIKTAFKLFQGVRSQEEDQKLYEKIMEYFFDEISKFMVENLSEEEFKLMLAELEKAGSVDEKSEIANKYMRKIPDYEYKLNMRLDGYINRLLIDDVVGKMTK